MQMIKPIIPHAIHDPPPPPEDANIAVVKGVLNTTEDMYQKLQDGDSQQKSDLQKVANMGKNLLQSAYANKGYKSFGRPHIPDTQRNRLLQLRAAQTARDKSPYLYATGRLLRSI